MRYFDRSVSTRSLTLAAALVALASAAPSSAAPCGRGAVPGPGLEVVGLTSDDRLICFHEKAPAQTDSIGFVTGLSTDVRLVGIDFRPATRELWALGNAGGLYVIDLRNAVATLRARSSVALTGTNFGIDFNPTVDRLRVVGDDGQNLRVAVDTGAATVDGALSVTSPTVATGVIAAAYTNNDDNPNTGTTLFVLDATTDQVFIQAPPNNGSLNAVGKLALDAGSASGFDIYSQRKNGPTVGNTGYAVFANGSGRTFYQVNLLTGRGWPRGNFKATDDVVDVAVPFGQN
jgi:hypothetical protein